MVNNNGNITTTDYAGNFIYENNVLQFFNTAEGYVGPSGNNWNYVYQYKDHLGNIRLSYQDKNNDGVITASTEIVEENNYYPFGLKQKGYNNNINGVANKYKLYNGKELNESLGINIYEMDARSYDPALARFTSIDPVTHFDYSTYSAFDNNPIYWADPSGVDAQNGDQNCPNCDENGQSYIVNGRYRTREERNAAAKNTVSNKPEFSINGDNNENSMVINEFIKRALNNKNSNDSTKMYIFSQENKVYEFMSNESTMDREVEIAAYIGENNVYVLPWKGNTKISNVVKPQGMYFAVEDNKTFFSYYNRIEKMLIKKIRILAQVHIHLDHGDLTGSDDNTFSKIFKVPVFIIHPNGVSYLTNFSSFLGKKYYPNNINKPVVHY